MTEFKFSRYVQLLLVNHFLTALAHCACDIVLHVVDLGRQMQPPPPFHISLSNGTVHCLYGEIPQTATFAAIMVTLCMLVLERIRATIDYRTYESAGGFHGYLLMTIQVWFITYYCDQWLHAIHVRGKTKIDFSILYGPHVYREYNYGLEQE